jgi:hypothetical protein
MGDEGFEPESYQNDAFQMLTGTPSLPTETGMVPIVPKIATVPTIHSRKPQ